MDHYNYKSSKQSAAMLTIEEQKDICTIKDLIDSHTQLTATVKCYEKECPELVKTLLIEMEDRLNKAAQSIVLYMRSATKGNEVFIDNIIADMIHRRRA
jgi:hypothetical protein